MTYSGAHCRGWDADVAGGSGGVLSDNVDEDDGLTQRMVEVGEKLVQLEQLRSGFAGRCRPVRRSIGHLVEIDLHWTTAAKMIDARPLTDPAEPRGDLGSTVESVDRPERLDQRLLHEILDVLLSAHEGRGDPNQAGPVTPDQLLEGPSVAAGRSLSEDVVRFGTNTLRERSLRCRLSSDRADDDGGGRRHGDEHTKTTFARPSPDLGSANRWFLAPAGAERSTAKPANQH